VPRAATVEQRTEKQFQAEQAEIEQYKSLVELIELKVRLSNQIKSLDLFRISRNRVTLNMNTFLG
jgi:hypothetical protein